MLDELSYKINAEKYGIDEKELEGLELEEQVKLISDQLNEYIDQKTAEKEEYDRQKVAALKKAEELKIKRSKAKAKADSARTVLLTFKKDFNDNIGLINYKKNKSVK